MKYPPVRYDEYLQLEKLLGAQQRESEKKGRPAHDEMLFIIIHQVYELWFKQILFELDHVLKVYSQVPVPEASMGQVVRALHRINEIFRILVQQVSVLETMTPFDFMDFRDDLYPASGFQSLQFRLLETKLGLSSAKRIPFAGSHYLKHLPPDQQKAIEAEMSAPSLKDHLQSWLERTPFVAEGTFDFWNQYFDSVRKMIEGDMEMVQRNPRLSDDDKKVSLARLQTSLDNFAMLSHDQNYKTLQDSGFFELSRKAILSALFILIYRDEPILHKPFEVIQGLQDLDEAITQWRGRHALMAHRMIGTRIGTGGSSGGDYLQKTASQHKIFTDFFNLSTFLIPRSQIPKLPESLKKKMSFM
jgi:tryptophan 2,3-dioxygenase